MVVDGPPQGTPGRRCAALQRGDARPLRARSRNLGRRPVNGEVRGRELSTGPLQSRAGSNRRFRLERPASSTTRRRDQVGPTGVGLARGEGLEPSITGPEPVVLPITPPPNAHTRRRCGVGIQINRRPVESELTSWDQNRLRTRPGTDQEGLGLIHEDTHQTHFELGFDHHRDVRAVGSRDHIEAEYSNVLGSEI